MNIVITGGTGYVPPLLIPGATYRLLAAEGTKGFCNKLELRVAAGQSLKLPDVVIERPQ